jgi:hypothetical protein
LSSLVSPPHLFYILDLLFRFFFLLFFSPCLLVCLYTDVWIVLRENSYSAETYDFEVETFAFVEVYATFGCLSVVDDGISCCCCCNFYDVFLLFLSAYLLAWV